MDRVEYNSEVIMINIIIYLSTSLIELKFVNFSQATVRAITNIILFVYQVIFNCLILQKLCNKKNLIIHLKF